MKETDCRKCCVDDFKHALCEEDFCEKYYREGSAEDFEKLLPHWIPCSERLPEEKDARILKKLGKSKRSDYVLITVDVKGERMTSVGCTYDGIWNWDKKYAFPDYKVIAWMPLPEPWKGGADMRKEEISE